MKEWGSCWKPLSLAEARDFTFSISQSLSFVEGHRLSFVFLEFACWLHEHWWLRPPQPLTPQIASVHEHSMKQPGLKDRSWIYTARMVQLTTEKTGLKRRGVRPPSGRACPEDQNLWTRGVVKHLSAPPGCCSTLTWASGVPPAWILVPMQWLHF